MRRAFVFALTCSLFAGAFLPVRAELFEDSAHYIKSGYHANQMWPWPYQCPDRIAVRQPFEMMVNNGWRRQNLLGAHHFNPDTNRLTSAGELRVQWIMTQAPPERRNILVEHSLDANANAARMAAVRDYATKVSTDGRMPQVEETYLVAEGRPAAIVDATSTKFMQNMPTPVLPAATSATGGTGSGQ